MHNILKNKEISNDNLLANTLHFEAVFNWNYSGNYIKSIYNYTESCFVLALISLKYKACYTGYWTID